MQHNKRPFCSHCIYWVGEEVADPPTIGHCHRYPPKVFVVPHSSAVVQRFPITENHHWCGEWNGDEKVMEEAVHEQMEIVLKEQEKRH